MRSGTNRDDDSLRKAAARDLPWLHIARFFAALSVAAYHFVAKTLPPGIARQVLGSGSWGVAFFFLLSGFVLGHAHADFNLHDAGQVRSYAVRRASRIYPVYLLSWLLMGIVVILEALAEPDPWLHIARRFALYGSSALLLVQSWIPGMAQKWNWPGWSLCVEAFFYSLFPLLAHRVARLSRPARIHWFIGALLAFTLLRMLARSLQQYTLLEGTILQTTGYYYMGEHPLMNLPLFVMGVLLARGYAAGLGFRRPRLWLGALLVINVLTLAMPPDVRLGPLRPELLLAPEYALIILLLAQCPSARSATPTVRLGVLLGKASYPLYMLQIPCFMLYGILFPHAPVHSFVSGWGFIAGLVALSVLVHLGFEVPADRALRARLLKRPEITSAGSPALPGVGPS